MTLKIKPFVITTLGLSVLGVYLFVNAPLPLQEAKAETHTIPIKQVLAIMEAENDVARELYTKDIVGAGKKQGLKFDEDWEEDTLHAGPLPAQFLKLTSRALESSPVPLGLFLGSDYAINTANNFEDKYLDMFQAVKTTRDAIFFYVEDAARHAYMAPDVALVKPCVTCHNEHDESPKDDWVIDDVMGATTWTYPKSAVGYKEALDILAALRSGFRQAYQEVLNEAKQMKNSPEIGEKWPKDGRYLPSISVFMTEVTRRSSANVLGRFIKANEKNQAVVASHP